MLGKRRTKDPKKLKGKILTPQKQPRRMSHHASKSVNLGDLCVMGTCAQVEEKRKSGYSSAVTVHLICICMERSYIGCNSVKFGNLV